MIDNLLNQLNSRDPEQRKKAIKGLAQTKDRSVLKYLAAIIKTDADPEIRDLAMKAGRYIQKNAAEPEPEPEYESDYEESSADSRLDSYSSGSPYPDEDDEDEAEADHEPLPDEIVVSDADIQRAKGHVQTALNWHMKEDNDKAAQYLSRAFRANPKLKYDGYTKGLAATITGMAADEAVKLLSPSAEELRKRVKSERSGDGVAVSGTQRFLAFLTLIGAATLLVSFLTFPWVDFAPIPVTGLKGEPTTFGQALADLKDTINALVTAAGGANSPQATEALNALNGLKIDFTGLDTTLIALGSRNLYEVMGFQALANISGQQLPPYTPPPPKILDYTLLLVPVVAAIALLLTFILLIRRQATIALWVISILLGLIGMLPFWYFYTDARQTLIANSANLGTTLGSADVANLSGVNVIAIGFWLALASQLAVLFLPFFALLAHPSPDKSAENAA